MGSLYYITCVVIILGLLVTGGILDLILALTDGQTISEWLMDNILWWVIPATFMHLFLLIMTLHLFALARD